MSRKTIALVIGAMLVMSLSSVICTAADKIVEISVQDVWSDSLMWGRAWLDAIATFEAKNPDIKIQRTYVPMGQNIERIMMQTITKNLPDVICCDTQDVPHLAETGALLDLSPYVAQLDYWDDDVYQGSRDAVTWNGKPYAIQFTTNCIALHYNKDLFEEAGLSRPPETWHELLEWSKKLTKDDVYGLSISFIDTETATWDYLPFLWSNGGSLMELDSPEAIEALEFLVSLVENGCMSADVVNWQSGDTAVQFRLGKAAMMINGCWEIPLSQEAGINFGIATIPVPKKGMNPIVAVGGETFSISPFSPPEKQEAAWRFFSWLMGEEGMAHFNLAVNNIPTRDSVAQKVIRQNPTIEPFVEQYQYAVNRFTAGGGTKYPQVSAATRKAIQKALIGSATPEAALKAAAAEIRNLMNE